MSEGYEPFAMLGERVRIVSARLVGKVGAKGYGAREYGPRPRFLLVWTSEGMKRVEPEDVEPVPTERDWIVI